MKVYTGRGLTLLEVLISLTLFATITVITAQALKQGLTNKSKIQSQLDEMGQVRDALSLIRRDLALGFYYIDLEKESQETLQKTTEELIKMGLQEDKSNTIPLPLRLQSAKEKLQAKLKKNNELRLNPESNFKGLENSVFFISTHRFDSGQGDKQGHYFKIAYQVAPCPLKTETPCLIRYSSPVTDGDIDQISNGTPLLQNVTEFQLRYLGIKQQDWINSWDSRSNSESQKNRYPEAVEVSIKVESGEAKTKKSISMQAVTYLHFPNNIERQKPASTPLPFSPPSGGR